MRLRKLRFALSGKWRLLRYATNVLGCSRDAGQFFLGSDWGQEKCKVLYYGIPLEIFDVDRSEEQRSALCRQYGISGDATVVGHAGGLNLQKNQGFLLRVFRDLAARDERYVLFIAGEGALRPELEKAVRQYNLENRVFMPGSCDNVPELMSHLFDVFLFPSIYEGLGLVLIEAAAGGLHCVCSDVIPKEGIDAVGDSATPLSLTAPIEVWSDAVVSAVEKRKTPKEGLRIISKSDFDRNKSLESLIDTYRASIAR